jgi:ADP-ribose pyrophosphatase YjhB (NUDIX family)
MATREMLTVYDAQGSEIGVKSREEAHRDGDWHRLVFVWAARTDAGGECRMLLQIRSREGDPYRGQVDAPAGGHVSAGESPASGALRELAEETGVLIDESGLTLLGTRRLENHDGVCRRVFQTFFLARPPITLDRVAFNDEVDAFAEVELDAFEELVVGRAVSAAATLTARDQPDELRRIELSPASFAAYTPAIMDTFRRSLRAIRAFRESGKVDETIWR